VINDVIPAGLTYIAASIAGGDSNSDLTPSSGAGLSWTINTLGPASTVNLTFQARVNAGAKATYGAITNTATRTSSDQVDDVPANDNGSVLITILGIDLEILKTVSVPSAEEGQEVTYTLVVSNNSGHAGNNIVINDIVPNGLTYVPGSITGGDTSSDATPDTLTGLQWNIISIAAGANTTLTFRATVDNLATTLSPITNTANITSFNETEEVPADNTSSVPLIVIGLDIEVLKVVNDATPEEGEEITYTITVNNLSTQTATNLVIRDLVPVGITYVPGSITCGSTSNDATPDSGLGLEWTIAS
jgi:uncharacterized repeat protein (TIGR01451 family)